MGMGEALGMMFSGAAGEYAGNRATQIRTEDAARLAEARETRMAELQQRYAVENREDQQAYGTSERESSQTFQAGESQKNRDFTTSERQSSQAFQAGQNALNRQNASDIAQAKLDAKSGIGPDGKPLANAEGGEGFDKSWVKNDQGQWGRMDVYSNGQQKWTPATAQMSQTLNNRDDALRQADSPGRAEKMILDLYQNPDVGTGTARSIAGMSEAGKVAYEVGQNLGFGNKQLYNKQKQLEGILRSEGVANAKALGASGINTIAEAKMYAEGMPPMDYSSPENYKQSLRDILDYIQENKRAQGVKLGVPAESYKYMDTFRQDMDKGPAEDKKAAMPAYVPSYEAAAPQGQQPAATGQKKYW